MTDLIERGSSLVPAADDAEPYPYNITITMVPPPRPPDLEAIARQAIEQYLEDEYALILSGNDDPNVDARGDGAQLVNYVARQLQLHAAAVAERITGKPVPTGTVRHPWADDLDADNPPGAPAVYPDLPPVGHDTDGK